jgi:hypothetical protein
MDDWLFCVVTVLQNNIRVVIVPQDNSIPKLSTQPR